MYNTMRGGSGCGGGSSAYPPPPPPPPPPHLPIRDYTRQPPPPLPQQHEQQIHLSSAVVSNRNNRHPRGATEPSASEPWRHGEYESPLPPQDPPCPGNASATTSACQATPGLVTRHQIMRTASRVGGVEATATQQLWEYTSGVGMSYSSSYPPSVFRIAGPAALTTNPSAGGRRTSRGVFPVPASGRGSSYPCGGDRRGALLVASGANGLECHLRQHNACGGRGPASAASSSSDGRARAGAFAVASAAVADRARNVVAVGGASSSPSLQAATMRFEQALALTDPNKAEHFHEEVERIAKCHFTNDTTEEDKQRIRSSLKNQFTQYLHRRGRERSQQEHGHWEEQQRQQWEEQQRLLEQRRVDVEAANFLAKEQQWEQQQQQQFKSEQQQRLLKQQEERQRSTEWLEEQQQFAPKIFAERPEVQQREQQHEQHMLLLGRLFAQRGEADGQQHPAIDTEFARRVSLSCSSLLSAAAAAEDAEEVGPVETHAVGSASPSPPTTMEGMSSDSSDKAVSDSDRERKDGAPETTRPPEHAPPSPKRSQAGPVCAREVDNLLTDATEGFRQLSPSNLQRRSSRKRYYSEEDTRLCSVCQKECRGKRGLGSHMHHAHRRRPSSTPSDDDPDDDKTVYELFGLPDEPAAPPPTCPKCGIPCADERGLTTHSKGCNGNGYEPRISVADSRAQSGELSKKRQMKVPERPVEGDGRLKCLKCLKCGIPSPTAAGLASHMKICNGNGYEMRRGDNGLQERCQIGSESPWKVLCRDCPNSCKLPARKRGLCSEHARRSGAQRVAKPRVQSDELSKKRRVKVPERFIEADEETAPVACQQCGLPCISEGGLRQHLTRCNGNSYETRIGLNGLPQRRQIGKKQWLGLCHECPDSRKFHARDKRGLCSEDARRGGAQRDELPKKRQRMAPERFIAGIANPRAQSGELSKKRQTKVPVEGDGETAVVGCLPTCQQCGIPCISEGGLRQHLTRCNGSSYEMRIGLNGLPQRRQIGKTCWTSLCRDCPDSCKFPARGRGGLCSEHSRRSGAQRVAMPHAQSCELSKKRQMKVPERPVEGDGRLKCLKCGIPSPTAAGLANHMKICNGNGYNLCRDCPDDRKCGAYHPDENGIVNQLCLQHTKVDMLGMTAEECRSWLAERKPAWKRSRMKYRFFLNNEGAGAGVPPVEAAGNSSINDRHSDKAPERERPVEGNEETAAVVCPECAVPCASATGLCRHLTNCSGNGYETRWRQNGLQQRRQIGSKYGWTTLCRDCPDSCKLPVVTDGLCKKHKQARRSGAQRGELPKKRRRNAPERPVVEGNEETAAVAFHKCPTCGVPIASGGGLTTHLKHCNGNDHETRLGQNGLQYRRQIGPGNHVWRVLCRDCPDSCKLPARTGGLCYEHTRLRGLPIKQRRMKVPVEGGEETAVVTCPKCGVPCASASGLTLHVNTRCNGNAYETRWGPNGLQQRRQIGCEFGWDNLCRDCPDSCKLRSRSGGLLCLKHEKAAARDNGKAAKRKAATLGEEDAGHDDARLGNGKALLNGHGAVKRKAAAAEAAAAAAGAAASGEEEKEDAGRDDVRFCLKTGFLQRRFGGGAWYNVCCECERFATKPDGDCRPYRLCSQHAQRQERETPQNSRLAKMLSTDTVAGASDHSADGQQRLRKRPKRFDEQSLSRGRLNFSRQLEIIKKARPEHEVRYVRENNVFQIRRSTENWKNLCRDCPDEAKKVARWPDEISNSNRLCPLHAKTVGTFVLAHPCRDCPAEDKKAAQFPDENGRARTLCQEHHLDLQARLVSRLQGRSGDDRGGNAPASAAVAAAAAAPRVYSAPYYAVRYREGGKQEDWTDIPTITLDGGASERSATSMDEEPLVILTGADIGNSPTVENAELESARLLRGDSSVNARGIKYRTIFNNVGERPLGTHPKYVYDSDDLGRMQSNLDHTADPVLAAFCERICRRFGLFHRKLSSLLTLRNAQVQLLHQDYQMRAVPEGRRPPRFVVVPVDGPSSLYVVFDGDTKPRKVTVNPGAALSLRGDILHCGTQFQDDNGSVRLHMYMAEAEGIIPNNMTIPMNDADVPWCLQVEHPLAEEGQSWGITSRSR